MKRLFALILALMLCVSLLSISATAAEAGLSITSASTEAGGTVTLQISAYSASLGAIDISYSIEDEDSILELVGFTGGGAGWTVGSHGIWYSGGNYNAEMSGSFTLTFKVKDDAQVGQSAKVSVSGVGYAWNEDGMTYEEVYAGATGTVTVACAHAWGNGVVTTPATCTAEGVMTYTCSICRETKTEAIPAAGHDWETVWTYDDDTHWHKCSACDAIDAEADHINDVTGFKAPTPEEDGYRTWGCVICGRYDHTETLPYGEEPKVGDIRPMMALGFSAVLFTVAAAAYVFKRKANV